MTTEQRIAQLEKQIADLMRLFENHAHKGGEIDRTKGIAILAGVTRDASGMLVTDPANVTIQAGAAFNTSSDSVAFDALSSIQLLFGANGHGAGDVAIFPAAETQTGDNAGFITIPKVNGTPTGTPTSYSTAVPMIYDYSADLLWVWNGSWKSIGPFT